MKVLVTGGGTVAPIDDVRVLTNASSGRFSSALTEACLRRGAEVTHVHTPNALLPFHRSAAFDLELDGPDADREHARLDALRRDWRSCRDRLTLVPVKPATVGEYARLMEGLLTGPAFDVVFLAMAVSDYEPDAVEGKISSGSKSLVIHCRRTDKVIQHVRDWSPGVFLVGFKLLSGASPEELVRRASEACRLNRADVTLANDLTTLRAGLHTVHLVQEDGSSETVGPGPSLADDVVDLVFGRAVNRGRVDE